MRQLIMGILVALHHRTTYRYDRPVTFFPHVIRLRPAPHCRTPVPSYSLRVEPETQFLNWQQDPYSNHLARLVFPKMAQKLEVTVDLIANLTPINPFDFFVEEYAQKHPFQYDALLSKELIPYLEKLPAGPLLQKLIDETVGKDVTINDYLVKLNQAVNTRLQYTIRMEPGVQSPEETLELGIGSCRDFAWLLVQLCRHHGLAARFVSGYSIQLVPDIKPIEGPMGVAKDVVDLHAWAEVYIPGAGWIGLDATCGLLAGEGYIPLAATAEPGSAAPIDGGFGWNKEGEEELGQEFEVTMTVTRLNEAARVTKPYTEDQWNEIDNLGKRVDGDLREWDVRLTMGGEPTFVSIDDRDAPEWNIDAVGPTKRRHATDLLFRLRDKFAPKGLLHFGQGKWYPGESLPRWAFTCYWRKDGEPVWTDRELIAQENTRYGFNASVAEKFIHRLAENLKINPKYAIPGYEDAWYYMWRERRLPVNVDPLKSNLDDVEERKRLAQVFEQQLGSVVGYALPLRKSFGTWESGKWFFRKEHMYLYPGDSPMGFRLPLDSIPWEAPENRQFMDERDPFAKRPELPSASQIRRQDRGIRDLSRGAKSDVDPSVVRTALCVEPRNGTLHVFLPPKRLIEDYIELAAAIEQTASELGTPVRIEGYKPPSDPRVNHFSITPDPGVIEANMHPASSWDEAVNLTNILYEEARQARLSSEKFMLDGRHTGTGGGNHIVMGSYTPAESPFLRRPDLLKSLVGFWINHPSLSYLFSGLFIGPTSQHPRIDEARHDALRELEIAFAQVNSPGEPAPPAWLVDRLFRNLLVDATGNTHRTEFCIDKLFSPDSASGRLGLVELRSFEMPPHPRMSCVQQLLIRSLVSWFWKKPYKQPLVRWGTSLYDRFMLPHFVERDFKDVLMELRERGGYALDPEWFNPHVEFRFPIVGTMTHEDIHTELRTAIEPWHVLGEEGSAGGPARYVDTSVERLQVKLQGMTEPRHVLTCNGRRVPLHPTGTAGEFVAGVRYRAWQPPSCLHPTIPVHAPLVFDLYDTWNERSVAGCTYHVAHPGGRSYDALPVNALEAESRRVNRFFPFGHTPGKSKVPNDPRNPEFPYTLDLREPREPADRKTPQSTLGEAEVEIRAQVVGAGVG